MKSNNNKFLGSLGDGYDEAFFTDPDKNLGRALDETGILVLSNFVSPQALAKLQREASVLKSKAYRSTSVYNVYVLPDDKKLSSNAPRNKKFETTKGCISDDQVPKDSLLRIIYNADSFLAFICKLHGLKALFPYADKLSSININYYDAGDSLEWHFDNADFAVSLLLKQCEQGGIYQYVPNMRYKGDGKENHELLEKILDGKVKPQRATVKAGDLMIFRGNRSLHRVTKVQKGERVLVTLNYNEKPGISLSEKSRMTFFGRT